jgi:membrane-associated phospholipid phosphatase
VCIVPMLFILYNVYTGQIGDIHMQHRHERYRPLLVTIVANVVALALLILQDAPVVMKLLAIMSLIEVVIISAVTLYWQISMHAMAITGATMAVGVLLSLTLALLMIPLIVLVGAARLRLDRHTPMQVFAGAMVGAFAPVILFLMVLLI